MKEIGENTAEFTADLRALVSAYTGDLNDEQTRAYITNAIVQYVADNYSNAVEYRVVCDETNNTPETVDKNMLMFDLVPKKKGITIKGVFSPGERAEGIAGMLGLGQGKLEISFIT